MRRLAITVVVSAVPALFAAGSAGAATINVNTASDELTPNDGACSLREAVQVANTNDATGGLGGNLGCAADTAGSDTIVLTGGLRYELTRHAVDEANLWGDLDITAPLTIRSSGSGLAIIDGDSTGGEFPAPALSLRDRVINVYDTAGSVTLSGLRIEDGWVYSGYGGAGILNDAPVRLINSEVTGNHLESPGINTFGAGIYTRGPLGSMTMTGSTVAGNNGLAVGSFSSTGGGIAVYGAGSSLSITNSTISGNTVQGSASAPGQVGGVFAGDGTSSTPAVVTVTHATITQNAALNPGGSFGGGIQMFGGTLTGSIVAGNMDPLGTAPDCVGTPDSGGANVIGNTGEIGCLLDGPNDLVGTTAAPVNANLGTLVNNGGFTRTHLPNAGSPAINRGGPCPTTDQRGYLRASAAPCDSGAIEVGASPASPQSSPPPAAAGPTGKRAAALKKCKRKHSKKARKRCRKRAKRLPV